MTKAQNNETVDPFMFENNESLDSASNYTIVGKKYPKISGDNKVEPIARGGAGIVYRARFKDQMDKAIKILRPQSLLPRDQIENNPQQQELWKQFDYTFDREISHLIKLNHTNISKIDDYGTCDGGKANGYRYYVMDYIDGVPFEEGLRKCVKNTDDLLGLFTDLISALEFLHDHKILHADIKSENILVRLRGEHPQAILVDLGVAKIIGREKNQQLLFDHNEQDDTYFFSTKEITRPERLKYLAKRVDRATLRSFFPDHDFYAVGKLIEKIQASPSGKLLLKILQRGGTETLEMIQKKLTGEIAQQFASVRELKDCFAKLSPSYLAPMGMSELAISANVKKYITVPGGRVRLTTRLSNIVNSMYFQRLRNLNQLNFVYLLFPGAKHSRFTHSLMAYTTCREYVTRLLDDADFRMLMSPTDLEAILLFSLLHDVGHYPLSHMFEDFAEEDELRGAPKKVYTDDDLFPCFVLPPEYLEKQPYLQELGKMILEAGKKSGGLEFTPIYQHIERDFGKEVLERISQLVLQNVDAPNLKILRGLMDSPIDVDKVSYLRLDSLMSGVEYGFGLDTEALLASLSCPGVKERGVKGKSMLAIADKGLSAAEAVVMARYWMLKRVYWHHANRSIMTMVKFTIESLIKVGKFSFKDYFVDNIFHTDEEALAYLCALWEQHKQAMLDYYGAEVVNPALCIRGGRRDFYKRLLTIASDGPDNDKEIYQRIIGRGLDGLEKLRETILKGINNELGTDFRLPVGSVLVDIPTKKREKTGGMLWIHWQDERQPSQELFAASPVLRALSSEFELHTKKIRVYIEPSCLEKIEGAGRLDAIRQELRRSISDSLGIK